MSILRAILALVLLAAVCWIAVYTVSSGLLRLIRWPSRLNMEQRYPPHKTIKINRTIATVIGLIVAAIVIYLCAPSTMQSPDQAPAGQSVQQLTGPLPIPGHEQPVPCLPLTVNFPSV